MVLRSMSSVGIPHARSGPFGQPVAASRRGAPEQPVEFSAGMLLRGVRKSLGLSIEQLAARLGIPAQLVADLEHDSPRNLPPSHDVVRVVRAWMGLAGLDSDMVLSSMARPAPPPTQYVPQAPPAAAPQVFRRSPSAAASVPVEDDRLASIARSLSGGMSTGAGGPPSLLPVDDDYEDFADPQQLRDRLVQAGHGVRTALQRLRHALSPAAIVSGTRNVLAARPVRRLAAVALAMAALGGTVGYTSVGANAVSSLPAPASRAVRSLSDYFTEYFAPVRDGHRWIEVADPRSRRADKLPVARQSD